MNWGIFSLLGVVVVVLGGIAAFFVQLAKRAAALAAQPVRLNPASPDSLGFDGPAGLSGRFAFPDGTAPPLEATDIRI